MKDTKNSEVWEGIFASRESGKYPPISLVRFIAKNYYATNDRSSIKILEIGSGAGPNIWYLVREGFTAFGIDSSPTGCEKTTARIRNDGLDQGRFKVLVGDYLEKIDYFDDNYFDAIIDIESLYLNSFEDSKKMIEKCFSKLKHGGLLFSQTFSEKTSGLHGEEITYHVVKPVDGPLKNTGFARYTTKSDIHSLYKQENNSIKGIELQELNTVNGDLISEWLIEIEKN